MNSPIILIAGGTGVGTSYFALELAKHFNMPNVMSTDSIREVIRSVVHPSINQTIQNSTYQAGQTENYRKKSIEIRKAEILRGYKIQCKAVEVGIEGVIRRAIVENQPLIIEGAHIIPGKFSESSLYKENSDRFIEYLIFISNPDIHRKRFIQREKDAPQREVKKYLKNFKEIRWINDYLVSRAKRFPCIIKIDNIVAKEKGVEKILREYYLKQ